MALTQTQVSQLYVTLFGRASEGNGNKYWQNSQSDMASAAQAMLDTAAAKTYFGTSIDSNEDFIKHIYKNTLNKTEADDAAGIKFWVDALKAGNSRGFVVSELLKAATDPKNAGDAQKLFNNKVEVSNYAADKVAAVASASATDLAPFVEALKKVTPTSTTEAKAFVDTIQSAPTDTSEKWVSTPEVPGDTYTLTNHTDKATANVFNAPMVYNPAGTDRIKSLQDEDVLTGTAGRTDNTLNVEMGQMNGNELDGMIRTPTLNNIQNVNIQFTGDSTEVDLRYADSVNKVNIDKITKLAKDDVKVTNINKALEGMRVANASKATAKVKFDFKKGVLAGINDSTQLYLDNVLADGIEQTSNEGKGDKEGYEKVTLVAKNGVNLGSVKLNQLKELYIKGSGDTSIVDLENPSKPNEGLDQFLKLKDGGIIAEATSGLTKVDASGYNGNLTLDITKVIAPNMSPYSSGVNPPVNIIGGGKNDTFYSKAAPIKKTSIDAGSGDDKLVLVDAGIATDDLPTIKNVETLSLKTQGSDKISADLDAFDDKLSGVTVRNENMTLAAAAEFTLKNVSKALAESGNIVIEHSVDAKINENDTVNKSSGVVNGVDVKLVAELKDASGKDDTLAVTVKNAHNTQTVFNYEIDAKGSNAKDGVENITINDQDTETNIVDLKNFAKHTGTIKLTGGEKGDDYTINQQLLAKTIDAGGQISNLRLNVGQGSYKASTDKIISQDIKLGSGDDILTFNNLDDLDGSDKIDAGEGHDIVRAAFSKDNALNLSNVEELHVVAKNNVKLDMTNAKGIKKFVVMSDKAVDAKGTTTTDLSPKTAEPFGLDGLIKKTSIIELSGSELNALNFFGDLDKEDSDAKPSELKQEFNGVTLKNNTSEKLDVNINSSLDRTTGYGATSADQAKVYGATEYNVGQITAHGSKEINFFVKDEATESDGEYKNNKKVITQTTVNNVYANAMQTLTVDARGSVDLQVVSGVGTRDNVKTVDASKVGQDFKAHVKALGNDAKVTLADGNNVFSAFDSRGNGIQYEAGKGNNQITGNNKDDDIKTGNGNNTIFADQGNNRVVTGNGHDLVNALAGNDTIVLGKGNDVYVDNIDISGADHFKDGPVKAGKKSGTDAGTASTQVTKTGDAAMVLMNAKGDQNIAGATVKQWMAVGEGSELQLEWKGDVLSKASSTLDGSSALDDITKTDQNNNLYINSDTNVVKDFEGKEGNDVYIDSNTEKGVGKGSAVSFKGGTGNDAVVGGMGTDIINGGAGADVIVLQSKAHDKITGDPLVAGDYDGSTDVVTVNQGDSTAKGWDKVYMFDSVTAAAAATPNAAVAGAGTAGGDILKLKGKFDGTKFAGNELAAAATHTLNGHDSGLIQGHSVDNKGIVTFKSLGADNDPASQSNYNIADANHKLAKTGTTLKINASNLKDALAYLAKYYDGTGATVAFRYDGDGDDKYDNSVKDSLFVWQDGEGDNDTVVELVGVPETTQQLSDGKAANTVTVEQA